MKVIRSKKCRCCNELFKPYRSTQVVCSTNCAVIYSKQKKELQEKKMELLIKTDKEQKSISRYLLTTKTIVHKMVRLRDQGLPCISCGSQWTPKFQAGHYHKAELFTSIKFDFFNINGQCAKCNIHLEGNVDNYKLRLPYRIGQVDFEKLNKRAELDRKFAKHWSRTELQEIRNQAKAIIKKLT